MYTIKDFEDMRIDGLVSVAKVLTEYYKFLLGKQNMDRIPIKKLALKYSSHLALERQLAFCVMPEDKEIKGALFFVPNIKSPGPDGFTNQFF